ncbi:MAG: UvrD-helicase domain-containing protein [Verrucomicrobiota bacterium]
MLPHTLITASAGSGKTWRLTVRYLRLVMMGAEPESIVALTFSRKAAGEFFNAILHRLAEAASGPEPAAALARDIEMPGVKAGDFRQALVKLTSRLPFLMLGTLDSFFIRMARSFPFELGLSGDFALLDEHQLSVEKLRVYDRVFAPDDSAEAARSEFRRAFTEATFGKDEIRVRSLLDDFIRAWHYEYLAAQDGGKWGNPERIWPENSPVPGPAADRSEVIRRLETGLSRLGLEEKHVTRWTAFLEGAAGHQAGAPMSDGMVYLWKKLLPMLRELSDGGGEIKLDRKVYSLAGPVAEALAELCRDLIAGELEVVLRQTRGIFEVVRKYDDAYHTLVRRQGRLTFHDVQMILSGGLSTEASGHAAREARLLTHEENRQLMDYRLDARYDHWLLDEFQDTSRVQWRVLANLMDEAIQDIEGRKSFFAVGDQKQSIYEWRGGTPALFEELQAQYNLPGLPPEEQLLKVEPMSLSQRSGPAVIAMVNALLGDAAALAEVLPPAAVAKWRWQDHTSKNQQYGGAALAIEVDPKAAGTAGDENGEDAGADVDAAWLRAAELITELNPLKRGLTCAVLCHRNDRALKLTDFLRSATGMPVVCESDLSIARDNPATSALLSLLQAAAHPGDTFAWQHVLMTPLAAVIRTACQSTASGSASPFIPGAEAVGGAGGGENAGAGLRTPLARLVLDQVAELGFHGTLLRWTEELIREQRRNGTELDAFSKGRLDELGGCARQFDSSGSRDTDEFLAFARSWTERGASHDGALQVMTVHRSKGLTFDVVIIPDLGYPYTFINRLPVGRETDAQGEVNWLTRLPGKDIAEADGVLGAALQQSMGNLWCERIAGLYVMVTRARFANYLFLPPAPKKSSRPSGPSLYAAARHMLQQADAGTLRIAGVEYPLVARFGNPEWIRDHPVKIEAEREGKTPEDAKSPERKDGGEGKGTGVLVQPDLFGEPVEVAEPPSPGEPALPRMPGPPPPLAPGAGVKRPAFPRKTIPLRARRAPAGLDDYDGLEEEPENEAFFPAARLEARISGTVTHRLLSLVEWTDAGGLADFEKNAAKIFPQPDAVEQAALAQVRNCLRSPALAGIFGRPEDAESWQVWRERAYDVMLGGGWASGVFDRVMIRCDDAGRPVRAVIVDFKTEVPLPSPAEAAAAHRPQLTAYRTALAKLLGLEPRQVGCAVLFTRTGDMTEF